MGQGVSWSAALSILWYLWLAGTIGVVFVVSTLWLAPTSSGALRNQLIGNLLDVSDPA